MLAWGLFKLVRTDLSKGWCGLFLTEFILASFHKLYRKIEDRPRSD